MSQLTILIIVTIVLIQLSNCCERHPQVGQYRGPKISGDNGFSLFVGNNVKVYEPGAVYTVTLKTTSQFKFQRFILTTDRKESLDDDSPQKTGTFQLFGDSLTTFHEQCVNTISERNDAPKSAVEVMWTAPPPGSGCVLIRAMVLQDRYHWYADDGQLTQQICEISETPSSDECCACSEAKYNLVFEGLWSNVTHPKDFPFSLWLTHFSDIIGASHVKNFSFWGEGHIATDGFRLLAEWGSARGLDQELRLKSKYIRSIIKAAGLWYPKVNTNTTGSFKVDRKRHLISLVSMFGPSPDWVVGVSGLDLCLNDCSWKEQLVVDLYPWDSGTDSGITYTSPNVETSPRERMYRITTKYPEDPRAPFYNPNSDEMLPLAKLYLNREKVISKSCDESFLNAQIEVTENNDDNTKPECAVTDWSDWSSCSVTCGKGLRMRTREYSLPAKAQMFQCQRQLVAKEMCVADVPECNGEGVTDESEEIQFIDTIPEGVCSVTPWSEWSECSVTCGKGFKMRNRYFLDRMGNKKCPHISLVEKDACMVGSACTKTELLDPNCPVTEWSDWSPCSKSCGQTGISTRTRILIAASNYKDYCQSKTELSQQRSCGGKECLEINPSSAKEICMQPVEKGPCRASFTRWYFESKKLMCVPFTYGGCRGNENNFHTADECNNLCQSLRNSLREEDTPKPIDCALSEWGPWSECDQLCGPGRSHRTRTIIAQSQHGGQPCSRRLIKWRRCQGTSCST